MRYVVLFVIIVLVALCLRLDSMSSPEVVRPKQEASFEVYAIGRVEGRTPGIEISPEVVAKLEKRLVNVGDRVRKGQRLLQLDDQIYENQRLAAIEKLNLVEAQREKIRNGHRKEDREKSHALLRGARAKLTARQKDLNRHLENLEKNIGSENLVDDARRAVQVAQAELDAAQADVDLIEAGARIEDIKAADANVNQAINQLKIAEKRAAQCEITAPINGTVLSINKNEGEIVHAETLIMLADISSFRVRAFVDELHATRVSKGQSVVVTTDSMDGREYIGKIAWLSPRMEHKQLFDGSASERFDTKTRAILIDLDDASDLVFGMRVDVKIASQPVVKSAADRFVRRSSRISRSTSNRYATGD